MVQPRGELDLPQEALAAERLRELGAQHLDRDVAVVLVVVGQVDGGHAARAELAVEPIVAGERVGQGERGGHVVKVSAKLDRMPAARSLRSVSHGAGNNVMRLVSRGILVVVCFCASFLMSATAGAQNWSFDARNVGIGGVGSTSNVALDMVDEQRPYRAIVLPFGLFQILPNLPKLDPDERRLRSRARHRIRRQPDSLHRRARR